MARFSADQADNYGGDGGSGFFSIKNDKETKQVRFMYNNVDDIEGMSVHKVPVGDGDKERYVNCLREYNDPVDACPFCRDKKPVYAKLFIPVYNVDEETVQIWDRGKKMFQKMTSLCSRYATKGDLVNNVFDIERNGKPKDTKTTYEIYQVDRDNTQLEDLPDVPQILGGLVLDKTAEDMEYYLENDDFPPTDDEDEEEKPVRRRDAKPERREESRESRSATRRTPANRGRRDEDKF